MKKLIKVSFIIAFVIAAQSSLVHGLEAVKQSEINRIQLIADSI